MSVRFIVQAIPQRIEGVTYLQQHIQSLEVSWDDTGRSLGGFIKALRLSAGDPFVLLEDDVIITKNLVPKALTAITRHPDDLIQFHSRSFKDHVIGSRYKNGGEFYNHQCVYFPAGMALRILDYAQRPEFIDPQSPLYRDSDLLTQSFLKHHRIKYWVSIPSLADHLPAVSAVDPRRSKYGIKRQAHVFVDPEIANCPLHLLQSWKPLSA